MKKIMLALAALAATPAAHAQVPEGQGVPRAMWGKWGLTARACRAAERVGPGVIEMDAGGYISDGERNAAIRRRLSTRAGRTTYDVIFSAVADRQWEGRMTLRMAPGGRLGITNGRNAERLYVRCR